MSMILLKGPLILANRKILDGRRSLVKIIKLVFKTLGTTLMRSEKTHTKCLWVIFKA